MNHLNPADFLALCLKQKEQTVLTIDLRSTFLFNKTHITFSINVFIPTTLLKRPSFTCHKIQSLILNEDYKKAFALRNGSTAIILVDKPECASETAILMADKLVNDNISNSIIYYLKGGFDQIYLLHPDHCSQLLHSPPKLKPIALAKGNSEEDRILFDEALLMRTACTETRYKEPILIIPYLFIGDMNMAGDINILSKLKIYHVINASVECPNTFEHLGKFQYRRLPLEDTDKQILNLGKIAEDIFHFMDNAFLNHQPVLVYCRAGLSRSVIVIMAYLMHRLGWSFSAAYNHMLQKQARMMPNFSLMGQLIPTP